MLFGLEVISRWQSLLGSLLEDNKGLNVFTLSLKEASLINLNFDNIESIFLFFFQGNSECSQDKCVVSEGLHDLKLKTLYFQPHQFCPAKGFSRNKPSYINNKLNGFSSLQHDPFDKVQLFVQGDHSS